MLERIFITAGLILLGIGTFLLFRYLHMRSASKAAMAGGKPAVLYFRSDACAPCVTQGRFLQQLLADFGDRIVVEKVDAVQEMEKAARYGVFTLPTILIVDAAGQIKHANYGLVDTRKLATQVRAVEAALAP